MISGDNVEPRLARVIGEALQVDPAIITGDAGVDVTANWDSFGHLRVILDIEMEFAVQFGSTRIPEITTAALIEDELRRMGVEF